MLWMNRATLPRYTFKKSSLIRFRKREILLIICGKTQVSKGAGGLTIEFRCEWRHFLIGLRS